MSDLISRQAAIDAVDEALTRVFVEHRDIAEKMINKIPSAQPERKRGQWLDGYKRQTCSRCKGKGVKSWNYCPYCGADMKGGQDE